MKPTIAIITDDILFSNLFLPLLERKFSELEIHVCSSFQEIDACFEHFEYDLIIVDGGISNMSCIEVIQYIRMTKKAIAPVWFFPEIITNSYIYKSLTLGATKIINKPFDPYLVADEISELLTKQLS
ncbi:MAG: response regulator [Paludibacter sp.]|nr:response regulator [Paludibacter sp.]